MKMRKNTVRGMISVAMATLLLACGGNRQPDAQDKPAQTTSKSSAQKQVAKPVAKAGQKQQAKRVRLTEDNVVDELTRYGKENPESIVRLSTPKGDMVIRLYENTPLHRANFIKLIKEHYYDGTEFYRVIDHFMIQGGDTDGYDRRDVKNKFGKYTLPAEFRGENIHKRGALSMVREYENNPEKRSEAFEFFIVQGTLYTDPELNGTESNYNVKISPEHREVYKTIGGCAYLDGEHTVFGEVIDGLEVIDEIASVKTDDGDWPIEAVDIKLQIIK